MSYLNSLNKYRTLADLILSGEHKPQSRDMAEETKQSLITRPQKTSAREAEPVAPSQESLEDSFMEYMLMLKKQGPKVEEGIDTRTVTSATRPRSRDEGGDEETLRKQASDLLTDELFTSKLKEMKEKYPGLTEGELFRVIKGESAFNLTAKNPSGATGLFQFIPAAAKDLGVTVDQIEKMSAGEQLALYDKYLERWGYDGSISLGAMQAAPAFANKDPDTIIYKKGSAAWKQNPGWRDPESGHITLASIDNYYRRQ